MAVPEPHAFASGSRHSAIRALTCRMARFDTNRFGCVADRCSIGLDSPSPGCHAGAFGVEGSVALAATRREFDLPANLGELIARDIDLSFRVRHPPEHRLLGGIRIAC